jgi:L-asparagine transporter-like permease
VLISAIVSSMLATLFGLGRTLRSLAEDRLAPDFLRGGGDMPRRAILASGVCALAALAFSTLFRRAYVFLLGAGGFAAIFTYGAIMASHLRHRGACGCPPNGKCQLPGYPYTSVLTLVCLAAIAAGMPFVEGQGASLFAGLALVAFFTVGYRLVRRRGKGRLGLPRRKSGG